MAEVKRTEIVKEKAPMREIENHFSTIFHTIPNPISIIRMADYRFIEANPSFCSLFGFHREQVVGRTSRELNLWVEPNEYERVIETVRIEGRINDIEIQYQSPVGKNGFLLVSGQLITLAGEECALFSGQVISERKQIENNQQEQIEFLTQVINSMGEGLTITNIDRQFIIVNPALASLIGRTAGEMIGMQPTEITIAEDVAAVNQARERRLLGEITRGEVRLIHKDGSLVPVLASSSPRTKDGKYIGTISVFTDLSGIKHAEKLRHESEDRFNKAFRASPIGICIIRLSDGRPVDANEAFLDMIGYLREELLARPIKNSDFLVDTGQLEQWIQTLSREGFVHDAETTVRTKSGEICHLLVSIESFEMEDEALIMMLCVDITSRKQAEGLHARLGHILSSSSNEIYMINAETLYFDQVNQSAQLNLGYTEEELAQLTPANISDMDLATFIQQVEPLKKGNVDELIFETNHRRRDGTLYPVEIHMQLSLAEQPGVLVAIVQDISERKHAEERLRYLANYDDLTGLPNRILFRETFNRIHLQRNQHGIHTAVMFLDLDRFKSINDTLGHGVGDKLLQVAAERITGCLREGDICARQGGDEFTIALLDIVNPEAAAKIAGRIIQALNLPFLVEGSEIFSSASIGITLYPLDANNIDNLLKNADSAMYQAKAQGGGAFHFFTPDMNTKAQERLLLENTLRHAQENDEFRLLYQPQIDLYTEELIGFEALIRWEHPKKGLLSPDKFIPIAEETGLIVPIGEWVLRTAAAQWCNWRENGLFVPNVSVNLSIRQFTQKELVEIVGQILHETGMEAGCLVLELTESIIMTNAETSKKKLEQLKSLGVKLAIDDFGTGYSSLSYLKQFPIDMLKIDRSFIRDIHTDPNDAAIVKAILALAGALQIEVLAEGVENEEQLAFLKMEKCKAAQGFLFSVPIPSEQATRWLDKKKHFI